MDKNEGIVLWIAGGAGVILIYSAFKNKSVTSVFTDYTTGGSAKTTAAGGSAEDHDTGNPAASPTAGGQFSNNGYVYDANGSVVGSIPDAYSGSPGTYRPGNVV